MIYILFTKLFQKQTKKNQIQFYFKTENSTIGTVPIFYTHVWWRIYLVAAECQSVTVSMLLKSTRERGKKAI